MTLASSGSINLAGASTSPQRSVLAELGATAPISLISTSTRSLTGISSGPITMPTDFYGKSLLSYLLYLPYTSTTEGNVQPVVALTSGVANGTVLYWTIVNGSTTNADFTIPFGSVTINSGSGQIDITHVSDGITETGGETYTVQLRTGSTSGSVVATSGVITINEPASGSYLYYFAYPGLLTSAQYFTVPTGMTSIDLVMVGGGGGGGTSIYTGSGSSVAGSGGGGGGQVRTQTGYSVTPGEILTVTIGAGGGSGSAGGITSIQGNSGATLIQAEGGGYGGNAVSSGSVGGTGGNSKNFAGTVIYGGSVVGGYGSGSGAGGAGTTSGGDNGSLSGPGGNGGAGSTFTLGSYSWNLGGGGGGGGYGSTPPASSSSGGFGGGGAGSQGSTNNPTNGTFWTGGGGGGSRGMTSSPTTQGGASGAQGGLYFVSTVQPTPKLAPSVNLAVDYGNAAGSYAQGWTELSFGVDGRMTTEEGNNSTFSTVYSVPGSWLNSSPAGTSTSTSGLYDIELTPSNHTLSIDGSRFTSEFSGATRSTLSTGTSWNTRHHLGIYNVGRLLSCDADNSAVGSGTVVETEFINFTATIYLHATNTVVTSTQVQFDVQVYSGVPL